MLETLCLSLILKQKTSRSSIFRTSALTLQVLFTLFGGCQQKDIANYESLGELIHCGGLNEQDAALGTGSTVYNDADGLYYTFYTGHRTQASASDYGEMVMMATSPDFKVWTKNHTFRLKGSDYGYSRDDFRDPFVFKGDDK